MVADVRCIILHQVNPIIGSANNIKVMFGGAICLVLWLLQLPVLTLIFENQSHPNFVKWQSLLSKFYFTKGRS
jgi:hypothetical protein